MRIHRAGCSQCGWPSTQQAVLTSTFLSSGGTEGELERFGGDAIVPVISCTTRVYNRSSGLLRPNLVGFMCGRTCRLPLDDQVVYACVPKLSRVGM